MIDGDGLLRGRSCTWTGPDEARCQLILDCALPVRPPGWDSLERRVRAVLWHVMDGNKVGKYGDFHMLPSTVRYDRTHPVQLTASNLALPLKNDPGEKEGQAPAQVATASATNENTRACQDRPGRDIPSQRGKKKLWVRMVENPTIFGWQPCCRYVTAIL